MHGAAPLLAQEERTLAERNVYLFMPDGRMISMPTDEQKQAMIMRNFHPAQTAMLAYASAGKLYLAEDHKMDNGKMLTVELFGRDFSILSQH
jgi:hypothetical protein